MQNLVKVFVQFIRFHVHVQSILLNLINIGYQLLLHHLNQGMPVLKLLIQKKKFHYNDWIIMELLDNKKPQVEFENIHALILEGILTNK